MPADELKRKIEIAVNSFQSGNLRQNAVDLFKVLGYNTSRQSSLEQKDFAGFKSFFLEGSTRFNEDKALAKEWKYVDLLFQLSKEEVGERQITFSSGRVDNRIIESYLFFAIELEKKRYTRTALCHIAREVNKLFPMPAMILIKYGQTLTLSIIDRRLHKRDQTRDVLEKVTLIKDINIGKPHRAHIEILFDLSIDELRRVYKFTDFVGLHNAWKKTLDTKRLNEDFFSKLFNWYLWASRLVEFPQVRPEADRIDNKIHQGESLIRLLTRILFCWFMKEKGLIKDTLFNLVELKNILRDFNGISGDETIYYKAILQNLFFATLNKPIPDRRIIKKGYPNPNYGDPLVYRYPELFTKENELLNYFSEIPFLNGGLFDCLDTPKDSRNPIEIRLDGFSSIKSKQPVVPDKLFFGEYKGIDLSADYDDKNKRNVTVYGLIDILDNYKFTIEENTPIEEEIALDPELLGKVFEKLLASYNPETRTSARKRTGSFYTPREIVNYMVDESLIAYLTP
ncbi:MAG: hypothetical protein L0Y73_04460, partial [Candidatus Aminicenantes bacterium]|nr:hypothetical protein [Candidatus Aminicenantes bacterium]